MLAIDTNVLVRVLADDPAAPEQCLAARQMVATAGAVCVQQEVQIETAWVLGGAYGLDKTRLRIALGAIANHPAISLQNPKAFESALAHFIGGHGDFADCVILAECELAGHELATFDRKLGRLPGARLVVA